MKNKILSILKASDGYVSGENISARLGISRSAVCKHIKKLRSEGYGISSVTNRGYRLESEADLLTADSVKDGLTTEFIARNIVYMDEADSTNNAAKRCCDMPDGTLFISEIQTGGKGRRGHTWASPKGEGIWMSLLLKPDMLPKNVAQITLIAGMAAAKGIGCGAGIKWPNDVVIGARKVCGILTELSAEIERVNYVVCGIGINVNTPSFDGELSDKATSMHIETGKRYKRAPIVRSVMTEFERLYKLFLKGGMAALSEEYRGMCVTLGNEVSVIYPNRTVSGRAVDIDNDGQLIVETADGVITVDSGEVSVRGIYGYI